MEIRTKMNQIHQIAGYVSLAGMIGSGITGQMAYDGNDQAKSAHQIFTGVTNFSYFGSLALSLFSPPPMRDREAGFTKLNIHKTLAVVHVASMLATNILSGMLEDNRSLVPYHRAASITAFPPYFWQQWLLIFKKQLMDFFQILWDAAIYLSLAGLLALIITLLMGLRIIKTRPKLHLHKKVGIIAFTLVAIHGVIMIYFYFFN